MSPLQLVELEHRIELRVLYRERAWLLPRIELLERILASAGEAGTATTPQSGVVHEHATRAAGDAQ